MRIRFTRILCDGCGALGDERRSITSAGAASMREWLVRQGWLCNGKGDWCPRCRADGKDGGEDGGSSTQ